MVLRLSSLRLVLLLLLVTRIAHADAPAFDLTGPQIDVRVTRAGKTLPIANIPNLAPGDRLWVHPNFPPAQSVHYLLILAFLRGSTNPPPETWFVKAETWTKQVRDEGIFVTVPQDAQQVIVFLAPETSGDFSTLRNAVRGRPGAFVRASQDLNQASLDRERLDKYLATVRDTNELNPKALEERSTLLARSLNIRLDHQCFDKPTEQQAPCLVENTSQLVLDDGHSQSVVASLTSGTSSDLLAQVSYTHTMGGGYYSAYVGAIVDTARILDSLHTAAYQYLPALAIPNRDTLNLKLNTPPSFHNPKSVLVVALPAVDSAKLPPLRAVDPKQLACLQKSSLVLAVDGAPLVFSTGFFHDVALRVEFKPGQTVELPAVSDPARGGFVVDTKSLPSEKSSSEITAVLHGLWGFQPFDGPAFRLLNAHSATWSLAASDQSALILGRKDTLHFQSEQATCVDDVTVRDSDGTKLDASWKLTKRDELQVDVPLQNAKGGQLALQIHQASLSKPDEIPLHTYSEAGHLDSFTLYADDPQGTLKGTRLDEVESLDLNGLRFNPAGLSRADQQDSLQVAAANPAAIGTLQAKQEVVAKVTLKDGRTLNLHTVVKPSRPKITLLTKSVQVSSNASIVRLGNQDELPQDGKLMFALKSQSPVNFQRDEKIEVASEDGSFHVLLGIADGGLTLQDTKTVFASLDPEKAFGLSAFGPLRFRPIDGNGVEGDWQPLVTLVRIPQLSEVRCPKSPEQQCTLTGTNLFLVDSVASDAEFTHTITVPEAFVESSLAVPHPVPNGAPLYIKLRDDPTVINTAVLPVQPLPAPPSTRESSR
jgi:hypothetical protein